MTERASIVARGERLELWFVREGDAWTRVSEHGAARVEAEADAEQNLTDQESIEHERHCPTGTIWQRRFELMLPRGTRLRQRQTWPRVRKLSVMGYLKLGVAQVGRVVSEREFIVTGNYRLTPVGAMQLTTEPGFGAAHSAE